MSNQLLRVFTACAFFITLSLSASAQRDIVYLKNGSIIKGSVLEIITDSTLKIQTKDGSLYIYKTSEVQRTEKEQVSGRSRGTRDDKVAPIQEDELTPEGFYIIGRFGPNIRVESEDAINASASLIGGYHFNKYLSIGLGLEYSQYTFGYDQPGTLPVYPIYIDARFHIPKGRVNPMFNFQIGYALTGDVSRSPYNNYNNYDFTPKSNSGGLYMAVGAGVRIAINKRIAFLVDGGFSFQNLTGYNSNSYWVDYSSSYAYDYYETQKTIASLRMNMGLAISFGK